VFVCLQAYSRFPFLIFCYCLESLWLYSVVVLCVVYFLFKFKKETPVDFISYPPLLIDLCNNLQAPKNKKISYQSAVGI
jgi:hypothetical protein